MQDKSFNTVSPSQVQAYMRQGRQLQAEAMASSFRRLRTSLFGK